MNAKVKILTGEGPIHWPGECARCCATGRLQAVHVGIARNVTSLVDGVQGKSRYQTLGMHYPVCNAHAAWAAFASWLTRKSPLPNLLRGAAYLVGTPAVVLFAMKGLVAVLVLWSWYGGHSRQNPWPQLTPDDWFFPLVFACCAVLLVLVLMAFRRVPVRLLKLESDALVIRFANERFARHFARANAQTVLPGK
jgi:hypothetical protein